MSSSRGGGWWVLLLVGSGWLGCKTVVLPVEDEPPFSPSGPSAPRADCVGLLPSSGDVEQSLVHDGLRRTYRVHVPPRYDPRRATALVLNFHGYGSDAQGQEEVSGLSRVADEEGFIAVHPSGASPTELGAPSKEEWRAWNAGACCGAARKARVDDVGFVRALLDQLETTLCLDRRRIYATGFSNGGFLAYRLGCELSDRIAAIAPVAGVNGLAGCAPPRPVPLLHLHGTADRVIPFEGNAHFLPVRTSVEAWAKALGCDGAWTPTDDGCEAPGGCDTVRLCPLEGGAHTWPGRPRSAWSNHLEATRALWRFFAAHPR